MTSTIPAKKCGSDVVTGDSRRRTTAAREMTCVRPTRVRRKNGGGSATTEGGNLRRNKLCSKLNKATGELCKEYCTEQGQAGLHCGLPCRSCSQNLYKSLTNSDSFVIPPKSKCKEPQLEAFVRNKKQEFKKQISFARAKYRKMKGAMNGMFTQNAGPDSNSKEPGLSAQVIEFASQLFGNPIKGAIEKMECYRYHLTDQRESEMGDIGDQKQIEMAAMLAFSTECLGRGNGGGELL